MSYGIFSPRITQLTTQITYLFPDSYKMTDLTNAYTSLKIALAPKKVLSHLDDLKHYN